MTFVEIFVQVLILLVILYFYNEKVYKKKSTIQGETPADALAFNKFPYGICSCCDDCDTCCLSIYCFACRVTDTYITAGITERSAGALTPILIHMCSLCAICCYLPCKRGELHRRLGGTGEIGGCGCCGCGKATCSDWCLVLFCTLCTVVQEARAADRAARMKTTCCCCGLKDLNVAPLSGAIHVGP
eukprot:GEMP01060916.1.p1 GENE.GEMP01060916.1~~GEMP01060916.1.p1  ORF type:complete len:187 (+),score=15.42 GEMP01060916.1:600-1160(+)